MSDPHEAWLRLAFDPESARSRLPVEVALLEVQAEGEALAAGALRPPLQVLDQGLQFVCQLHYLLELLPGQRCTEVVASTVAWSQAIACLVGVRRLIVSGLAEVSKVAARAAVESLDLGLACLVDPGFARLYYGAIDSDDYDANKFWNAHIRGDRLQKRLDSCLTAAGLPRDLVAWYFKESREARQHLSGAVHGALDVAVRSFLPRSFSHPAFHSRQFLGHVSTESPRVLYEAAAAVHRLATLVLSLLPAQPGVAALQHVREHRQLAGPLLTSYRVLRAALSPNAG